MKTNFENYVTKRILEENGFFLSDKEIEVLVEGKFLDNVKKLGLGAAITAASLIPQSSKAATSTADFQTKPAAVSVSVPSNKAKSEIDSFWKKQGSVYSPIRGNGILLKDYFYNLDKTKNDMPSTKSDMKRDFVPVQVDKSFELTQTTGSGLTYDDAVQDALSEAVRYKIGSYIHSATKSSEKYQITKTSSEKEKGNYESEFEDEVFSKVEGIVGKFEVVKVEQKGLNYSVKIKAEVQIREKSMARKGIENSYRLDDKGNFRTYKQTLNY